MRQTDNDMSRESESRPHVTIHNRGAVEWPTWLLIFVVYGSWLTGLILYASSPHWIILPFLIVITAWYMSLQHELIHGHPTSSCRMNRLLGLLPLAAWYPYDLYRRSHLTHHRDQFLTLPGIDPESNYLPAALYQSKSALSRQLLTLQRTVLGRFMLGPAFVITHLLRDFFSMATWRNAEDRKTWIEHVLLLLLILWALWRVGGIPPWIYLGAVAYPALGLAMLRSFYEHKPADDPQHRIVINEASLPWRLLFLNNNFHAVHHEHPGLPWYRIPSAYWADRSGYLARNGGFLIPGYLNFFARHVFTAVDSPEYPSRYSSLDTRFNSIEPASTDIR